MDIAESVVRGAIGLSNVAFLFAVFLKCWRAWRSIGLRQMVQTVWLYFLMCFRIPENYCVVEENDMLEQASQDLAWKRLQQRVREWVVTAACLTAGLAINIASRCCGLDGETLVNAKEGHITCFIPLGMLACLCVLEGHPSRTAISVYHFSVFACLLNSLQYQATMYTFLLSQPTVLLWRVSIAFLPGRCSTGTVLNIVFSVLVLFRLRSLAAEDGSFESILGPGVWSRVMFHEISFNIVMLTLGNSIPADVLREAQATIEAKDSKKWKAALIRMLQTGFQVFVELDDELRIVGPALYLAGFLLKGGDDGRESLESVVFPSLLATDVEQRHFQDHVTHNSEFTSVPSCMHMLDCYAAPFVVQIYHTCFEPRWVETPPHRYR
eukprot:TRINITY_DN20627_c0_g1_i1.p1 TRINITY_DN20627_c0_g1~~TRINITY_DN20627_c0_g1_i1.p1  ORF type:complete len:405 (+),score=37.30 TRINITY_DN20627_c0_g1_i1:75-1217(+)